MIGSLTESTVEEIVEELEQWAAEGALGAYISNEMGTVILSRIAILRDRIDELGGYHDDL
jgi:hypothetical protein